MMADDEIDRVAQAALDAAAGVIAQHVTPPQLERIDVHKLATQLYTMIRDAQPKCSRCHGGGIVSNRMGIVGFAPCPECRG
jgi:hypothetical protein